MGYLRFRRSVRLFPGVRVNLGKRGASLSVGVRGAHVTVGHGKVRETVGIPGTGLSYTTSSSHHAGTPARQVAKLEDPPGNARRGWLWLVLLLVLVVWGAWAVLG
jgi:hypothetical protein